jgi:hypothetical protein
MYFSGPEIYVTKFDNFFKCIWPVIFVNTTSPNQLLFEYWELFSLAIHSENITGQERGDDAPQQQCFGGISDTRNPSEQHSLRGTGSRPQQATFSGGTLWRPRRRVSFCLHLKSADQIRPA